MTEQHPYNTDPGKWRPASGYVTQDADGRHYGWHMHTDEQGRDTPYLISDDQQVIYTLEQAAFLGAALPAGFDLNLDVMHEIAAQSGHSKYDLSQDVTETPRQQSDYHADQHASTFTPVTPKSRVNDIKDKVASLNKRASPTEPSQWRIYQGWGAATTSFIRGDTVARGAIAKILSSRSQGFRKMLVVATKVSPALVPVEAITPIPGDEVITSTLVIGTVMAIAKRRKKMMNGEL